MGTADKVIDKTLSGFATGGEVPVTTIDPANTASSRQTPRGTAEGAAGGIVRLLGCGLWDDAGMDVNSDARAAHRPGD